MTKSINWEKFEDSLFDSIERNEYLLERSKAIYEVERDILKHKSEKALKSFKAFLKQIDKAIILDSQKITMIKDFKVTDHL
jgi:hypothetical protein